MNKRRSLMLLFALGMLLSSDAGRITRSALKSPSFENTSGPFSSLNPEWMKYLADEEKLISEVTIPGTHDSFALYGGVYHRTNSKSCREQLDGGIRYFDPRPRNYGNGSLPLHHDYFYMRQNLRDVLQCVSDFLDEYPSEFVIFRIKEEYRSELSDADRFESVVYEAVSPYVEAGKVLNISYIPKIKEVRGKMFILENYYAKDKKVGYPYSRARIQDQYSMFSVSEEDLNPKWDAVYKHMQKIKFGKSPFLIHLNHLSASGIFAPPKLAASKLNPMMLRWLQTNLGKQRLGIIIMDFPGSDLIANIIMTNRLLPAHTVDDSSAERNN